MNKTPASILSDEEIDALWYEHSQNTGPNLHLAGNNISQYARAIEAKVLARAALAAGVPTPVQFKPVAKGSKPLIVGEQVLIMAYIPTEK